MFRFHSLFHFLSAFLLAAAFACRPAAAHPMTGAVGVQAVTPVASLSAIRDIYNAMAVAGEQRDLDRAFSFLTPDYAALDLTGARISRDQARRDCESRMAPVKSLQSRCVIQSLVPTPGGAWVEMRTHSEGVGEKRILFMRIRAPFTNDLHVRDFWINKAGAWRLKFRQVLQDDTHIH